MFVRNHVFWTTLQAYRKYLIKLSDFGNAHQDHDDIINIIDSILIKSRGRYLTGELEYKKEILQSNILYVRAYHCFFPS